jgi:hypothetical protein
MAARMEEFPKFAEQPFAGKAGYMTKKGGMRKNWLRRWCVLSCDHAGAPHLNYFDDAVNKHIKGCGMLSLTSSHPLL